MKQAAEKTAQTAQIIIPVAERLGQNVVDFEHLRKGYGDNLLIDDLTFKLPPGGIVGVIGPNGAGKTTLFQDDHRAGEAGRGQHSRSASRCISAMSISPATASTARRTCGRKFQAATTSSCSASAR